jgi:hypothetical protein
MQAILQADMFGHASVSIRYPAEVERLRAGRKA